MTLQRKRCSRSGRYQKVAYCSQCAVRWVVRKGWCSFTWKFLRPHWKPQPVLQEFSCKVRSKSDVFGYLDRSKTRRESCSTQKLAEACRRTRLTSPNLSRSISYFPAVSLPCKPLRDPEAPRPRRAGAAAVATVIAGFEASSAARIRCLVSQGQGCDRYPKSIQRGLQKCSSFRRCEEMALLPQYCRRAFCQQLTSLRQGVAGGSYFFNGQPERSLGNILRPKFSVRAEYRHRMKLLLDKDKILRGLIEKRDSPNATWPEPNAKSRRTGLIGIKRGMMPSWTKRGYRRVVTVIQVCQQNSPAGTSSFLKSARTVRQERTNVSFFFFWLNF